MVLEKKKEEKLLPTIYCRCVWEVFSLSFMHVTKKLVELYLWGKKTC